MPRFGTYAATWAVLVLLIGSLAACSSSKPTPKSGLAAALDITPADAKSVLYTDWAALGHRQDAHTAAFAGQLVSYDVLIQKALGFRSTDASWEADIINSSGAPVGVFQFDGTTDLNAVADRLVGQGYHKSTSGGHDVLTGPGPAGMSSDDKQWMISMLAVGIDTKRELLMSGPNVAAVNAIFQGGRSLAGRGDVKALSGRVGPLRTGAVSVDSAACQPLSMIGGPRTSPLMQQQLRQRFTALGSFSRFTADIVGLPTGSGSSGLAALTFPDGSAARANVTARSAAPKVMSTLVGSSADSINVSSATVKGPVLMLSLQTSDPRVLPQAVQQRALGFDICP